MLKKIVSLLGLWKDKAPSVSKFPYQYKVIDFGKIPDPLIKVDLKTNFGYLTFKFLVDSGADVTTLPFDPFGKVLDFTPNMNNLTIIEGVEGEGIRAYWGEIEVKINNKKIKLGCFFIKNKTLPLLGRLDFWDKYNITFDNRKQEIVFEEIT